MQLEEENLYWLLALVLYLHTDRTGHGYLCEVGFGQNGQHKTKIQLANFTVIKYVAAY